MRLRVVISLLFTNAVFSASIPEKRHGRVQRRQSGRDYPPSDFLASLRQSGYGKVADPPGAAPRRVTLQSPSKIPGVKRVKIRSGPYKVGNMTRKSYSGHAGMLENYPDTTVEKPCSDECTILTQEAGLEYPDGSNANIDTGMWLHHMVHFNTGPTKWDAVAYGRLCIPYIPVRTKPEKSERYFTAGNERTPFHFNQGGTDLSSGSGYHLTKDDKFAYLVELMNMNMKDTTVYLTMTYDYLEGPLPKGWNNIKTIWLDANQCGTSEVRPPKQDGPFTIKSQPWSPNFEGKIVSAMGHLHDGGIQFEFLASANTSLCRATAKYSETAEYKYKGTSMGGDKVAQDHISSMPGCQKSEDFSIKEIKRDQSWTASGHYNYTARQGNLERGRQADVSISSPSKSEVHIMALGLILVSVPPGPIKPPS